MQNTACLLPTRALGSSGLNRTILELKPARGLAQCTWSDSLNRTILELRIWVGGAWQVFMLNLLMAMLAGDNGMIFVCLSAKAIINIGV